MLEDAEQHVLALHHELAADDDEHLVAHVPLADDR